MLEIIQSIFIGGVQGITEFLPISSSAHLVLVPYIFNWQYVGLDFDIALHFGTVLAIIVYFFKDWIMIFKQAFLKGKNEELDLPASLLWQIAVASIPAAIVGYFLRDLIESHFHFPLLIATNMAIFGLIFGLVDRFSKNDTTISKVTYPKSFIVGIAQSLALIPGISRSGITIVAAKALGLKRDSAARFSFLLGMPAMIGAFVYEFKPSELITTSISFYVGVLASFVVGYFAISFLLNYLKKRTFAIFVWYRLIFAAIVFAVYYLRLN